MSTEKKVDPEKIQIVNIRTIKGNINGTSDIDETLIGGHQFNFELGTGLNPEENIVGLQLMVSITAKDKNEVPLDIRGSYTHEIIFIVENLNEFLTETGTSEKKKFIVDGTLGSILVSIAYSTVRGIIFTRTQGTSLGTVILPVIDPKQLMKLHQ
ncbi:MAG: hypothetical protein K2Q24_14970 [Chitinophagaceae bacterium]|jgi:hypothetical protein|nr:hypothetical protein [Chitinophagaceae bacterium]